MLKTYTISWAREKFDKVIKEEVINQNLELKSLAILNETSNGSLPQTQQTMNTNAIHVESQGL